MPRDTLYKNNECMTYQLMKVLNNVKYQYFSFVSVVTMPSIGSNNVKLLYLSVCILNNQFEILRQIETGVSKIETNL